MMRNRIANRIILYYNRYVCGHIYFFEKMEHKEDMCRRKGEKIYGKQKNYNIKEKEEE